MLLFRPFLAYSTRNHGTPFGIGDGVTRCINSAQETIQMIHDTFKTQTFFQTWYATIANWRFLRKSLIWHMQVVQYNLHLICSIYFTSPAEYKYFGYSITTNIIVKLCRYGCRNTESHGWVVCRQETGWAYKSESRGSKGDNDWSIICGRTSNSKLVYYAYAKFCMLRMYSIMVIGAISKLIFSFRSRIPNSTSRIIDLKGWVVFLMTWTTCLVDLAPLEMSSGIKYVTTSTLALDNWGAWTPVPGQQHWHLKETSLKLLFNHFVTSLAEHVGTL
jgi:hypothetical protein